MRKTPEALAGIEFGDLAQSEAKMALAVFNLAAEG